MPLFPASSHRYVSTILKRLTRIKVAQIMSCFDLPKTGRVLRGNKTVNSLPVCCPLESVFWLIRESVAQRHVELDGSTALAAPERSQVCKVTNAIIHRTSPGSETAVLDDGMVENVIAIHAEIQPHFCGELKVLKQRQICPPGGGPADIVATGVAKSPNGGQRVGIPVDPI